MELRKDPVTQNWMLVGDDTVFLDEYGKYSLEGQCCFCPGGNYTATSLIASSADGNVRVYPHPHPIYRVEGAEGRAAEGIYDLMRTVGAHEIVIENRAHDRQLSSASDHEAAQVLIMLAQRIADLKKDLRLRYVNAFKNYGALAGEEFAHPYSQITATPFVPRRLIYELSSARQHYQAKERCVFCDIVQYEEERGERLVETTANYLALCPFASRVPYELWIIPRYHSAFYEYDIGTRGDVTELGGILRRSLARVHGVADAYHMVIHTPPNTATQRGLTPQWVTIQEDYHWHIEILPIVQKRTRSYSIKEVYYNPVSPERAVTVLRQLPV